MNGYIAFFNGKQTEIHAETQYAAKVKAEEFFKPVKSKKHLITVVLAEKEGKQVVHTPDF
jgi:hypothetical protein